MTGTDGGPLLVAAVAVAMAVGLLGTVLPLLPGLALIWVAGLAYGLIGGFGATGWIAFAVMTVLLVVGSAAQIVLPSRAGVRGGAPRSTLAIGALCGFVGFFVVPVVGLPVGAVLGVLVAERRRLGDLELAWGVTRRVVTGLGISMLVELAAGLAMVVTWIAWVLLSR